MNQNNDAKIERDKAIERVASNNVADYMTILQFAKDWVNDCYKLFTVDDLKKDFFQKYDGYKVSEPRVFGAVFVELSKLNLIKSRRKWQTSKDPVCHARPKMIWISKVYSEKQAKNRTKKPIVEQVEMKLFN